MAERRDWDKEHARARVRAPESGPKMIKQAEADYYANTPYLNGLALRVVVQDGGEEFMRRMVPLDITVAPSVVRWHEAGLTLEEVAA